AKQIVRVGIVQKVGYVEPVFTGRVVHQGKDFGSRLRRLEERHDLVVDGVDFAVAHNVKRLVGLLVDALEVSVGREHVQPLGIQQVNLPRILAERRKTGRVRGHVERRSNSFIAVQLNLRRSNIGAPMAAARQLVPVSLSRFVPLGFLQRVIWVLLKWKEQLWQRLAQSRVNEDYDDGAENNPGYVQQGAKPAPASPTRIVENRLCHATLTKDILAARLERVKPLRTISLD